MSLSPFEFTVENLTKVTNELIEQFELPIEDFKIVLRGRKYRRAASVAIHANPSTIYMSVPYHDRYPHDYKVTLLHELGHIFLGLSHEEFYSYWQELVEIDVEDGTNIVPRSFEEFRYARSPVVLKDKWVCEACNTVKYYKKRVHRSNCNVCGKSRQRVSGFKPMCVEV
tara:strand:+ start:1388 stop:1894 length:507 start_codon:yes stop_codon:yes gene_type:complete